MRSITTNYQRHASLHRANDSTIGDTVEFEAKRPNLRVLSLAQSDVMNTETSVLAVTPLDLGRGNQTI
jgi:hypothetical protein